MLFVVMHRDDEFKRGHFLHLGEMHKISMKTYLEP